MAMNSDRARTRSIAVVCGAALTIAAIAHTNIRVTPASADPAILGSVTNPVAAPIVAMAATPSGAGYWLAGADGGIFTFGDAGFLGSAGSLTLTAPVVGLAATPTGRGYWLVASDGGIFSYGDARFYGSMGGTKLNRPIVGMASTKSGSGYWLVASDGGIFSFGDAVFFGSMGGIRLNQPVVGMAASHSGNGYWMVASDGGIFSFGDAVFYGSTGALRLNKPITSMAALTAGKGYWFVATDGGVFSFGDAHFFGSLGSSYLPAPIAAMAPAPDGSGYWLTGASGQVYPIPGPPPPPPGNSPTIGGCPVFPADNPWNTRVDALAVHPNSAAWITNMGASGHLHPDFGGQGAYGIPFITTNNGPKVPIQFVAYGNESDPGPYSMPLTAPVEAGSDAHVLSIDTAECKLYELYAAAKHPGYWTADSGAVWDLRSNATRPRGWTSADAAGLPIFAGLVKYDEVATGRIDHAVRFTVNQTQRSFIAPASHLGASSNVNAVPMGARFRLKASYDISGLTGESRVIAQALKDYGMINADQGSSWYITGAADTRWNDNDLNQLKSLPASAFEAVYTGPTYTS